ncbi:T9SS C-terminal target domain-containing protein [Ancylomarina euxinus]|uniref:T9SS C-terminal target domain-containing protein n=1 Tax=Ancylomarina euxinus TaxID=2283627 RepID=A0A425XZA5_9BACT|nr:chondroitinase family polysaccharide lyase [Ancylomarina euxinus]MCZ4694785.1 chondroitinase family polysaccharide lyase [Ancylomarina euxinus]MUP15859.1 T9SS type A sorting domain-containing protein [Ancylomarina euxinus]RRG20498.1 T9SS C-terminal target domain-containing protein [Ancylomarina euxinus]
MRQISLIFFLKLCLFSLGVQAQYIGLETEVPNTWSTNNGANLSMSTEHYKLGSESLKWDWTQGSSLTVMNPPNMQTALNTYKGGLMLWIYNETPLDKKISFQFGKGDSMEYEFDYGINFKGWRACWIRFDEDMSGPKSRKDLDYMKVKAPTDVVSGSLFFDRMMFPSERIHDRVTPDKQLPLINPEMNDNHWAALWHWFDTYNHDILLESTVSFEEQKAFDSIEADMIKAYQGSSPSSSKIASTKSAFQSFQIHRIGEHITGRPYVSDDEYVNSLNDVKMIQIGPVLEDLAQIWHHHKDAEARQMFYDLLDYVIDQGLDVGSGMGTNHHYGYNFREFPPAIFLMKGVLKEDGKLDEAVAMIKYWTGVQEYRVVPEVGTLQGLMDSWNTTVIPRLIAIMTMDDTPEKARELKAIKRWMDISLKVVPGSMGGIKEDGTGFHHGGLYPAYSKGGYTGIGSFLRFVNGTCFALSDEARINFGKALLTMRNYSNHLDWGFGICGRHPLSGSISSGTINAFAYLAKSGNPYTKAEVWNEMAASYMRLESSNTTFKQEFSSLGLTAEAVPEGNYTYNYGALGIHRRDKWMVSVKGYNKHVWGSEIYTKDNRYGRYQSYGTVQVIGSGDKVNAVESGFVENGWDWNRYPGATSIHLPLDLLESPLSGTLMEKSEEGFAGASNLNGENGIFGMKLREKSRTNFTYDHQANKSVFCFENRIICLGSDISNSNSQYKTETSLFQVNLQKQSDATYVDGGNAVTGFPVQQSLDSEKSHWLLDPVGNAFWIKEGAEVNLSRSTQDSRHNKTKANTQGDFAAAWINHGTSPSNSTYEYVVLPNSTAQSIQDFSDRMKSQETAAYKVLKHDENAHIVWDRETNTTGYVFFEQNTNSTDEFVKQVTAPSLVMIKSSTDKSELNLSLCDPDLHFPEVAYTSAKPSQESVIVLTLKGNWEIVGQDSEGEIISTANQQTQIQFKLKDGIPRHLKLKKKDEVSDNVPPIIYQINVDDIRDNSASIEIGSNESGVLFWYLNSVSSAMPFAADVINGSGAIVCGQVDCTENELWTGDLNNLQRGETYILYAVAKDLSDNISDVYSSAGFSTLVTGLPDINDNVYIHGSDGKVILRSTKIPPADTRVQVYDLMGRIVASSPYKDSTELYLDVPNKTGVYIVRLQMNGQSASKKLVIRE